MNRLSADDVACWVLKTKTPPQALDADLGPGSTLLLRRCVRRSYRLDLMATGQRCLLWLSGRQHAGVHAIGTLTSLPDDEPAIQVRLRLLDEPLPRSELVLVPEFAESEVVRLPIGSNPSYLTRSQLRPVLDELEPSELLRAGWS